MLRPEAAPLSCQTLARVSPLVFAHVGGLVPILQTGLEPSLDQTLRLLVILGDSQDSRWHRQRRGAKCQSAAAEQWQDAHETKGAHWEPRVRGSKRPRSRCECHQVCATNIGINPG